MDGIRHCISPTSLLPQWFQVPVTPSVFPSPQGSHVQWCRAFTSQGHPAKGVSGGSNQAHSLLHKPCALAGSGMHLPKVKKAFFQLVLRCSMVSPHSPVPCSLHLLLLCVPFVLPSPASNRADLRAAFTRQAWGRVEDSSCLICELCLPSPVVLFLSLSMLRVASRNCSAVINTAD